MDITKAGRILSVRARYHAWQGAESLSIKTFSGGRALYSIDRGMCAVDDQHYLIINHQQPYSILVDSEQALDSFCIFFAEGFAESLDYSLNTTDAKLLDAPETPHKLPIRFYERTYPHDELLSPLIFAFKAAYQNKRFDHLWIEQHLHGIMERILLVHQHTRREADDLPALRSATRHELYRRLHRARDFITASLDQPITLSDMAAIASLSTNHFLRMFKQAFHQTPHQYLTQKRLEQAQKLLLMTNSSVTEICLAVGFESLGAFSWLFRKHFGVSPAVFRQQKK